MSSKQTQDSGSPGKRKKAQASSAAAPESKGISSSGETFDEGHWHLRLFVAGQSPKSLLAYANLKRICDQYLNGKYHIELVDLVKEPHLAQTHQIVAVPTLIRQLPEPVKRVIGDLSNHERALVGMDLHVA